MSWRRFSIGLPSSRPCRARRLREEAERIAAYASRFPPESVQLAYQICAQGRADLALAPDEATGFSMTLLRLLAFEPATQAPSTTRFGPDTSDSSDAAAPGAAQPPVREPVRRSVKSFDAPLDTSLRVVPQTRTEALPSLPATRAEPLQSLPETTAEWPSFVAGLKLTGMAAQLAAQSELKSIRGNALSLAIPATHKHLADKAYADKLKVALDAATGRKWLLAFEIGDSSDGSLAGIERRERAQAKAQGEAAFRNEPFVRELVERFSATVRPETIAPLANANPSPKPGTVMMKNQLAGLMKQAQQMQENMQRAQEELARTEVEGQSGAGLVEDRDDVPSRREARLDRSFAARRRQGHAGGPRRGRVQRCGAPRRSHDAGKDGRPDGGHAAAAGIQAAVLMRRSRSDERARRDPRGAPHERCRASTSCRAHCAACPVSGRRPRNGWRCTLLQHDRDGAQRLAQALVDATRAIQHCERCNTFTEGRAVRAVPSAKRDATQLCVVETPADLLMVEQTQAYSGLYFVLMGRLSPLDGIGPKEIRLERLLQARDRRHRARSDPRDQLHQ